MAFKDDIKRVTGYFFPSSLKNQPAQAREETTKSAGNYISKVQFDRIKVDILIWRDAIKEAELAWYPHRVKMQRVFIDTVLNGHVSACMSKRKDLTLLKGFCIKDSAGNVNEKATALIQKQWFGNLLSYVFDAQYYGYSLIALNDLINDQFPDLEILKRWNVSPDRHQLVPLVYSLSGINFLDPAAKDKDGNSWMESTIWIDTPSDIGASKCGYGLLYKAAYYEILIRNNMGYNATALELYGQPTRVGKTTKTDPYERDVFFNSLLEMGSNAAILMDTTDEIELQFAPTGSGKNQGYANFEERCEQKISKLFFGHASALDAIAGKLGSEESAMEAIEATEKKDTSWMEEVVNTHVIPKLQGYGLDIPVGCVFAFMNDKEVLEAQSQQDDQIMKIADICYKMSQAGIEVDLAWVEERTGMKVTKKEVEQALPGLSPEKAAAIKNLYK